MPVEAEDLGDVVNSEHGRMDRVASCQLGPRKDDLPCVLDGLEIDRQHVVDDLQEHVEAWLDGIPPANGDVAVKDLLQDLGVGHETTAVRDRSFEEAASIDLGQPSKR